MTSNPGIEKHVQDICLYGYPFHLISHGGLHMHISKEITYMHN